MIIIKYIAHNIFWNDTENSKFSMKWIKAITLCEFNRKTDFSYNWIMYLYSMSHLVNLKEKIRSSSSTIPLHDCITLHTGILTDQR